MTTTFQDNQAVTLADLNNIAVDLGATTFSAFSEETFGVDKLNQITADLVSAGILRTKGNGNLGLEMGCKPTYTNGIVTIGHGTIVFASGAKTYIENPIELEAAAGSFIYALNDVLTGKASLQVSDTEPTEGDFVMLAGISTEGILTDKRLYAKSKTEDRAEGMLTNYKVELPSVDGYLSESKTIDIGTDNAKYLITWRGNLWSINGVCISNLTLSGRNFVTLVENEAVDLGVSGLYMKVKKSGQYLTFYYDEPEVNSYYVVDFGIIVG